MHALLVADVLYYTPADMLCFGGSSRWQAVWRLSALLERMGAMDSCRGDVLEFLGRVAGV
jgi:hypothetical protein